MIQGIAGALISSAEIYGIRGTCFVFSSWIGEGLEQKDVETVVEKLEHVLSGVKVGPEEAMKGWRLALGSSGADKSSIYL
jgi:hypothetical protein